MGFNSHFLLESLGWSFPPEDQLDRFNQPEAQNMIVVISHTSYWDFILLLLAKMSDPRMNQNLYLVMKPQPFQYWGWFLRPIGCLPATRAEDNGQGFVDNTIRRFKGTNVRLIISPEGKREASPWKSGYYHLAQGMKSSLMVAGLDYQSKSLYLGPIHPYQEIKNWSLSESNRVLQAEMGRIVPLYPGDSYVPITKSYRIDQISTIQPVIPILIVILILVIVVLIILLIDSN